MENLFSNLPKTYNVSGIYLIKIKEHLYVGSSKNIKSRLGDHRKELKRANHSNKFLQRAYSKYGDCGCCVLEVCEENKLLERESYWISNLSSDMNLVKDPTLVETSCLYNQEQSSKEIHQYKLSGEFIKSFPSVSEAARQLGVYTKTSTGSSIASAARKQNFHKSAYGFLWSYEKVERLPKYENNSKTANARLIEIKDLQTNETKQFRSIADSVKYMGCFKYSFAGACAQVSNVCRGRYKLFSKRFECRYI